MFKLAAMFKPQGHTLASLFTALLLSACASPNHADNVYINTMISGELMPGVYGQVNIGSVPDYVTVYEQPLIIVQQPVYSTPLQPIYLYVPPYHAYHWRDHCGYYNACARPVYFVCARDYRPHYFESRYYNTRVYDPPRVYRPHANHHHHKNHNRHYETMHQREMNRDSNYHRVDGNKGPYYRHQNDGNINSYYPQNDNRQNGYYRHNDGRREDGRREDGRRDNHRNDNRDNNHHHDNRRNEGNRHQQRDDKTVPRQQFIDNHRNEHRNDAPRPQFNRQPMSNSQPQRNDTIRIRSDNSRTETRQPQFRHQSHGQQPQHRPQMNNDRLRDRASAPMQQSRQPSFQHGQQQNLGGRRNEEQR